MSAMYLPIPRPSARLGRLKRLGRLLGLLLGLLFLAACGGKTPTYAPPDGLSQAPEARREFVNLFLQGQWCLSRHAFDSSTSYFLAADDFCQAAGNYILAHNLKAHAGLEESEYLDKAKEFIRLGQGCPEQTKALACAAGPCDPAFQPVDAKYRARLAAHDFKSLASAAKSDNDPFYGSVYARKGAAAALAAHDAAAFTLLLDTARTIDTRQGWLVFLREDWKLAGQAESDPDKAKAIADRVKVLDGLILPCDETPQPTASTPK